jgi:hypothetical protein
MEFLSKSFLISVCNFDKDFKLSFSIITARLLSSGTRREMRTEKQCATTRVMRKRKAFIHLIGLVVARATFYSMNPLSIGYFTAASLSGAGSGWAFIAAAIGIASGMNMIGILKYSLTLIASITLLEMPAIKKSNMPKICYYILPSWCCFAFP